MPHPRFQGLNFGDPNRPQTDPQHGQQPRDGDTQSPEASPGQPTVPPTRGPGQHGQPDPATQTKISPEPIGSGSPTTPPRPPMLEPQRPGQRLHGESPTHTQSATQASSPAEVGSDDGLLDELLDDHDISMPQPEPPTLEQTDGKSTVDGQSRSMLRAKVGDRTFDVPRPGRTLRDPRRGGRARRGVILATTAIVGIAAVSLAAFQAVVTTRNLADNPISEADTDRYHLDTYNLAAAESFGDEYLRTCMTRTADSAAEKTRQSQLNALAVEVDPLCISSAASSSSEPVKSRAVQSVTYAGSSTPDPAASDTIRFVTFNVIADDGFNGQVVLPIHLSDPQSGAGPRIAGPAGVMAPPSLGNPTSDDDTSPRTDPALAAQFQTELLGEFMNAWSTSTGLGQFTTGESTQRTREGLNGLIGTPTVTQVEVFPDTQTATRTTSGYTYRDGSRVTAVTSVATATAGSSVASTYRITLLLRDDHWFVLDINGAATNLPRKSSGEQGASRPTAAPSTPQ